ncbi:MAG: SRPBCC family protein [Bacteroidota bacterium]|jgi:uncharacterized protein YndB with AHSA1/START domain
MRTHNILKIIFLFALILLGLIPAAAEVKDSSAIGFTIQDTIIIAADPNDVYHSLVADVGHWWDSAHTFSGNASSLSIDDRAGGCFCEKLENGGSVRHLEVVFADPGKTLRMIGGLGPLQAMAVTGSMTWSLSKTDTGTNIKVTYTVGGYRPGGLQKMAPLVDKVMFEQLKRLKEYMEKKAIKK